MRIVSKRTGFDISCKLSPSKTVLSPFFRTLIQFLVTFVLIFNLKVLFAYTYQILRSPFRTDILSLGPFNINIPVLLSAPRTERLHYENTPIQIHRKFYHENTENVQIKNSDTCIFCIFCSKHRLWGLVRTASARRF